MDKNVEPVPSIQLAVAEPARSLRCLIVRTSGCLLYYKILCPRGFGQCPCRSQLSSSLCCWTLKKCMLNNWICFPIWIYHLYYWDNSSQRTEMRQKGLYSKQNWMGHLNMPSKWNPATAEYPLQPSFHLDKLIKWWKPFRYTVWAVRCGHVSA